MDGTDVMSMDGYADLLILSFFLCGKQYSVPYMWQIVFTNDFNRSRVDHSYVNCFFDGSSNVLPIPSYNLDVLDKCFLACCTLVFIYGWGCFQIFLKSFMKHSGWLPYIFFFTFYSVRFIPIFNTTVMLSLSFGDARSFSKILPPWKYTWMSCLVHMLLQLSHSPWDVGHDYVALPFIGWLYCVLVFGTTCKSVIYTVLSCQVVMAISLQILVSMYGLSVYSCWQSSIWF